jgi:peptidoglycan-associated lipoprotein
MRILNNLSMGLCSLAVLAACTSAPKTEMATAPVPTPTPASTMKPLPVAESRVQPVVVPPYLDPKSALSSNRSVYFDYDIFTIKPEYNQMLELHGKFLAANPKLSIRVEGNADERGSAEYNLALGQKRADTVVRALKVYGVKESQMEAISWGEEKPKATGQTEAAFSQNRRVDLGYPSK